ncbi:MAG: methyltransferase domain-containing protein [Clostridiales bacterium]|nr:methyltransferase domain-containing protein [Clostridiales bacterium]
MHRQRIIETNEGIQDAMEVTVFDDFARTMRDKGWNNVDTFVRKGISRGRVLEIGPGPGYVGLEWLKRAPDAKLTALEISDEMIRVAKRNAQQYGLTDRVQYMQGNAMAMPFEENAFDGVFSNGSLHEWEKPLAVFQEIHRVLKAGGLFCVTDMRRDVNPLLAKLIYHTTKPKEIRPGFITSLNAAYTVGELTEILRNSDFEDFSVTPDFFGLTATGRKQSMR